MYLVPTEILETNKFVLYVFDTMKLTLQDRTKYKLLMKSHSLLNENAIIFRLQKKKVQQITTQ